MAKEIESIEAPEADEQESFSTELSPKQKQMLAARARKQVQEELVKAASKAFLEAEVERLRTEAGMGKTNGGSVVSGSVLAELVTFTLDLPDNGTEFIQLDMPHRKRYYRGHEYTEQRHIFNELIWIAYRQQCLERSIKGEKPWGFREKPFSVVVNGKTGEVARAA